MGLKRVLVCVVLLMFLLLEGWQSQGCLDQERFALLQLKHFFNDPYSFQGWDEGDQNLDCCQWERVECSNTTGKIVGLDLSYIRNEYLGEWYLNVSLFSSFKKLEWLFLSSNLIAGCVQNEGFERLSHLSNLEILNLSENMLNDSHIFSTLSELSSLKYLDLGYNGLKELNHIKDLRFNNLKSLSLSGNMFNNSVLSSLATLSSLKELYINDIGLKGTVDVEELDSLSNLEVLEMGGSMIEKLALPKGDIGLRKLKNLTLEDLNVTDGSNLLQSFGSFPLLKRVELWNINFNGTAVTTPRELHNLTNVEELLLYDSSLHVSLLPSIGAFTSLELLEMTSCELNGILTDQDLPTFQNLKQLELQSMTINNFYQIIGSMTFLETLTLNYCNLTSTLAHEDLPIFKNLKQLYLRVQLELASTTFNSFYQIVESMTSLETLSIDNSLNLGDTCTLDLPTFKNLKQLELWSITINNFYQMIRSMTSLETLTLHDCNLTDMTMSDTAINTNLSRVMELMTSLETLTIQYCGLRGTLSDQGICGFRHLQELDLSYNELKGTLPWCLANMTSLQILRLSRNHFEGNISLSPLKVLTSIQELRLSDNGFEIPISLEPFYNHSKLKIFDGRNNKIYAESESHSLAPEFQLSSIFLSGCEEGGSFPKFLYHQYDLSYVFLFDMNLMVEFPNWLLDNNTKLVSLSLANNSLIGPFHLPSHYHQNLRYLDISGNSFSGHIPEEIGVYLPMLYSFKVSRNAFDGSIPSSLGSMKFLLTLDLSNNLLTGEIPEH